MQEGAKEEQIQHVIDRLVSMGFDIHRSTGASQTVLGAVGVPPDFDPRDVEVLDGVREVVRITQPYKLASRAFRPQGTVVELPRGVRIGGTEVVVAAGPCSVETPEQIGVIADRVAKAGAKILARRGVQTAQLALQFSGATAKKPWS
jgi:3-deoxy-7-phosphoheptulonate synthase